MDMGEAGEAGGVRLKGKKSDGADSHDSDTHLEVALFEGPQLCVSLRTVGRGQQPTHVLGDEVPGPEAVCGVELDLVRDEEREEERLAL